jgi:hypothetical protein
MNNNCDHFSNATGYYVIDKKQKKRKHSLYRLGQTLRVPG